MIRKFINLSLLTLFYNIVYLLEILYCYIIIEHVSNIKKYYHIKFSARFEPANTIIFYLYVIIIFVFVCMSQENYLRNKFHEYIKQQQFIFHILKHTLVYILLHTLHFLELIFL
jgi:hypothetical protein